MGPRTGVLLLALLASGAPAAEPGSLYGAYRSEGAPVLDLVLGSDRVLAPEQLMPALVDALDQLSKYPKPATLPAVLRVSRAQLETVACAGRKCAVLAIYRPEAGIYLDEALHPETSLFDRSVLLHELVHHVQELQSAHSDMRPCDRWYYRELEAYAVQKRFLMLVGSPVRVGYSAARAVCDDAVDKAPAAATRHEPAR